tara:strand:- start:644 stop:1198 length:555 start_codon:yes stop_codon:yes gene_type:complete
MVNEIFSNLKVKMDKVIEHFTKELGVIRTGRASTSMLDIVKVDYYGTSTPIKNIANITSPDPQSILVQPFDPTSLDVIEKGIMDSDLGMTPNNDGNLIRLAVPVLTEERRAELVKMIHKIIEDGRIAVRNLRRDANEQLKKLEKDKELSEDNLKRALDNVQDDTNNYIGKLNKILEAKEKELML